VLPKHSVFLVNSNATEIAKANLLDQVKNGVQTTTKAIVADSLAQYERDKGTVDQKELVDRILDNIRKTKYSDTGYYFVYQYDGIRLVAPENPAQEGKNLWDLTDEAGNKPVQMFAEQAKAGGGFVTYMWVNPSTKVAEQKVSYVAPLVMGDKEVLVGTGTYLPMLQKAQDEMSANQQQAVTSLMWILIPAIVVLVLVILLVIYRFFTRSVVKPLKNVTDAAVKIAQGDTDALISVKTDDEIGRVAKTIDNEVRQAFKQVERAREVSEKQGRYNSEHVNKLVVNLERLSKGELYCDMETEDPDSDTEDLAGLFENISSKLHFTVDTLKGYIGEMSRVLGAMSEGNLRVSIDKEYLGEFTALKDSINGIASSLSSVLVRCRSE
jgi:signal transduction histidine kinase